MICLCVTLPSASLSTCWMCCMNEPTGMNMRPGLASCFTKSSGSIGAAAPTWIASYGPMVKSVFVRSKPTYKQTHPRLDTLPTQDWKHVSQWKEIRGKERTFPAISRNDDDTTVFHCFAEAVLLQVLDRPVDELRDVLNTDDFSCGPDEVMQDGAEIAAAAPDIEHTGAWAQVWEEMLRRVGMLRRPIGEKRLKEGLNEERARTMCGALIVALYPIVLPRVK
ncbi:hypothetical protein DXG03_004268 [Asterophora parasitica]|uniref:Uncharacterized protein n=1 Tax=Asterophora parasitica TaxID=117018 RepID=A0A9P7K929_9AGAR|nr:hypothetical protein DXG03_004268 [Asterophora parasitica]